MNGKRRGGMSAEEFLALFEKAAGELDVKYSYTLARELEQFRSDPVLGYRTAGSRAEAEAGEFLYEKMRAIGLQTEKPLCRSVDSAELKPGEGSLAVGSVRIERSGWRFTRRTWRISFELCALRDGAVKEGVLELELSGNPPVRGEVEIPGFTAVLTPPEPGTELELAGARQPLEIIEIDIRGCYDALGEIVGETVRDDILDKVFERFCLGK